MTELTPRRSSLDNMVPEKCQVIINFIFSKVLNTPQGPQSMDESISMICYGKPEDIEAFSGDGEWARFKGQTMNPQNGELDSTMRIVRIPRNVIKYVVIQPPPSGISLVKGMPTGGMKH